MNTTIQKILEEEIRAGNTAFEFQVVVESSTLLSLLVQEAFLQREKKQTMSEAAFVELSEHLYLNADKLKDNKYFKGVKIDKGLERLIVTRKRFPKTLQEFALKRFETFKEEVVDATLAEIKENNVGEIVDDDPLGIGVNPDKAAKVIEDLKTDLKSLEEVKEELMTKINSRGKGGRGEREVIKILQPIIDRVFEEADELNTENIPALQRNLDQTRDGGYDIVGIDFAAIEVKFVETLALDKWFEQAKGQAGKDQHPILIYRQKGKQWRVVMFGFIPCGIHNVRTNVNIDMSAFIVWFETMLKQSLGLITD